MSFCQGHSWPSGHYQFPSEQLYGLSPSVSSSQMLQSCTSDQCTAEPPSCPLFLPFPSSWLLLSFTFLSNLCGWRQDSQSLTQIILILMSLPHFFNKSKTLISLGLHSSDGPSGKLQFQKLQPFEEDKYESCLAWSNPGNQMDLSGV